MALYQKSWWKKMFKPQTHEKKFDTIKDIDAIIDCLEDSSSQTPEIKKDLQKLKELETERQVVTATITPLTLEQQAQVLEKIIEHYRFLEQDININSIRLHNIAENFLKHAKKAGLKDLAKEKEEKWLRL